jgi:ribonucrease Y
VPDSVWAVVALLLGGAAGAGIGIFIYRNSFASRIRQTEAESRLLRESARSEQKDLILRAKDEALQIRNEAEAQLREARGSLAKQEERLQRKEENLDRKLEGLERRERQVQSRERQIEQLQQEAEQLRGRQRVELERISALSQEEARGIILQKVEAEARDDSARKIREIEQSAREEADKTARKIIGLAIQRCASEYVAEVTVSTVALPSEELKGRIIGREGRNIRADHRCRHHRRRYPRGCDAFLP